MHRTKKRNVGCKIWWKGGSKFQLFLRIITSVYFKCNRSFNLVVLCIKYEYPFPFPIQLEMKSLQETFPVNCKLKHIFVCWIITSLTLSLFFLLNPFCSIPSHSNSLNHDLVSLHLLSDLLTDVCVLQKHQSRFCFLLVTIQPINCICELLRSGICDVW